jgi:hypothetical protein
MTPPVLVAPPRPTVTVSKYQQTLAGSAVLASAGIGVADVVNVKALLTNAADVAAYRAIRAGHRAGSTLLVVSALANSQGRIEVEPIAAKL